MTKGQWIGGILLSLAGIVVGSFLAEDVIGGGALGWVVAGAIIAPTTAPLIRGLIAYRREKDRLRADRVQKPEGPQS
jgi:hypothetical protein